MTTVEMLKSKGGRKRAYETPELLEEAFYEYVDWEFSRDEFDIVKQKSQKNAKNVKDIYEERTKVQSPLSIYMFQTYIGRSESWLKEFEKKLKENPEENKKFLSVIKGIREFIKDHQIKGALSGKYKENIIARLHGIKEQQETEVKVDVKGIKFFDSEDE